MKHTPGPWTVDPIAKWDIKTRAVVICDLERFPVAWSPAWDEDETATGGGPAAPEEAAANARLIAASPRMLEALKRIAYEPQGHPESSHAEVLESVTQIALSAIQEAEGATAAGEQVRSEAKPAPSPAQTKGEG